MFEIIPGILEKDWETIERKIELVRPFAKSIHVDLLDGKFAPNTTFLDPKPFTKYANDFILELHIMANDPLQYLKPWADAGFKRFIGHIERMPDQAEFVAEGQLLGEVGLVIDGETQLDQLKVPYEDLDCLLIMTIKAGFSGQAFTPQYLEKVKTIRLKSSTIPIEVDGGINEATIVKARDAGATRFAATSAIYKGTNSPLIQFQTLNSLIKKN